MNIRLSSAGLAAYNRIVILPLCFFGALCFLTGRYLLPEPAEKNVVTAAPQTISDSTGRQVPAANGSPVLTAASGSKSMEKDPGFDELEWDGLKARPQTPAGNSALAEMLEKLARTDPDRAMKLAQAEGNRALKGVLLQSALHGWARSSPTNAANWALALTDPNGRENALSSVFAGAVASDPAMALQVGKFVIAQNPDEATGSGLRLIDALCDAGNFAGAAQMASGGDAQMRSQWGGEAYSKWAEFQPDQAAAAAEALTDPAARNEALHGIVGGWSATDPSALVQFVTQLPADADRDSLMSQSVTRWAREDPQAAAEWINSQQSQGGLDQGVAAVATTESLTPDTAVAWAEYIGDPQLRSQTLTTVLRSWLTVDVAGAQNYFNNTTALLPEDREEISSVLAAMQKNTAAQ